MIKVQTNKYDSSTVKASSYDYATKDLIVVFEHASYIYKNVDVVDYLAFANDKSQGIALNNVIKGKYEFEKCEDNVDEKCCGDWDDLGRCACKK